MSNKNIMKKLVLALALIFLISGCRTAAIPEVQLRPAITSQQNAASLGFLKVKDERQTEDIGNIGALILRLKKSDLSEMTTNYFIGYLNHKTDGRVMLVEGQEANDAVEIASKYQVNHVVISKVHNLKIIPGNEPMASFKLELTIELIVYNKKGRRVYQKTLDESFDKKRDISRLDQTLDKWFETFLFEALNELLKKPGLRIAMSRI